uniref:Uncharacterized protein n=1 Tax=Vibrio sp. FF_307 TaxID=1652834 RepID=A0A0H4A443_9VIBR|nr:hypothetical protein [Vibrio sp. FF_307]
MSSLGERHLPLFALFEIGTHDGFLSNNAIEWECHISCQF